MCGSVRRHAATQASPRLRRRAPPAPSGRLDAQSLTSPEAAHRLGWQLLTIEQVAATGTRFSTLRPPRGMAAAFRDDRVAQRRGRLEFAHDPVSSRMAPPAPRAPAQPVLDHAQGKLELERLNRGIERVAHRDMNSAGAIRIGAGALTAPDRLVINDLLGPQRDVIHRPLPE